MMESGRVDPTVSVRWALGLSGTEQCCVGAAAGSFLNNPRVTEQLTSRYELPKELRDALLAAPVVLRGCS